MKNKYKLLAIVFIAVFNSVVWVVGNLESKPSCNIIRAKEIVIADCASKGLTLDVPQDLEEQLQVIEYLINNEFIPSLSKLYMFDDISMIFILLGFKSIAKQFREYQRLFIY